ADVVIRDFHVTGVQTCALPIFEVFRTRETLDTEPNRFVRFALNQWRHVVQQISDALRSSRDATPRAIREVQNVLDHLDRYLEATDFPELSHLTRFPADNVVLHRAEGKIGRDTSELQSRENL